MKKLIILLSLCLYLKQTLWAQTPPSSLFHKNSVNESQNPSFNASRHRYQEKNLAKGSQTKATESEETKDKARKKEEEPSPHKLIGSVAFLSDYRSRGLSQTFGRPAVQGELKYTHESGVYFKSWGSNVDGAGNLLNNTSLEWDLFLGFQNSFLSTRMKYNVGFLYYYYPGGRAFVPANTRYNTLEYYLAFEYRQLELRLSLTLTDYFANNSSNPPTNWNKERPVRPNGHSYGSSYLELNYELPFCSKWKANFHVGYQNVIHYPQLNYVDWLVGLVYELKWFEITVTYVQTNANRAFYKVPDHSFKSPRTYLGGPGIVIGINKIF